MAHEYGARTFLRRWSTLVLIMLTLVVLSVLVARMLFTARQPLTYQGVVLPAPTVQRGPGLFNPQLPATWLLMDNVATPATYGGFCWRNFLGGVCADTGPPEGFADLATVLLPTNAAPRVVVDAPAIQEVHASVRPWTDPHTPIDPASIQQVLAETTPDGRFTVLTLDPLGDTSNHVLEVFIIYGQGRDAGYVWHLTPAP